MSSDVKPGDETCIAVRVLHVHTDDDQVVLQVEAGLGAANPQFTVPPAALKCPTSCQVTHPEPPIVAGHDDG